jgi:hypothetical protein
MGYPFADCSVLPYWLLRPRTMPDLARMSLMMAERLAATLAAASFRAAAWPASAGAAALNGTRKILLQQAAADAPAPSAEAGPMAPY